MRAIIPLLFLLLFSATAYAATDADNWRQFNAAWNARDWTQALDRIAAASAAAPTNDTFRCWHGIALHKLGRWDDAARILAALDAGYPFYPSRWYETDSLLRTGRTNAALSVVENVLRQPDDAARNRRHFYDILWRTTARLKADAGPRATLNGRHEDAFTAYARQVPAHDWSASFYWLAAMKFETIKLGAAMTPQAALEATFAQALALRERAGRWRDGLDPTLSARALLDAGRPRVALSLLEKIPASVKPSALGWSLAAARFALGETNAAAVALERSLDMPLDEGWRESLCVAWIRARTALVRQAATTGEGLAASVAALDRRQNTILEWCAQTKYKYADWIRFAIAGAWAAAAEAALAADDWANSRIWYDRAHALARRGLGTYARWLSAADLGIMRDAVAFRQARQDGKTALFRPRILGLVFDGEEVPGSGFVNATQMESRRRSLAASLKKLSCFYFYASNGKILFEHGIRVLPGLALALGRGVWQSTERNANGQPIESVPLVKPDLASLGDAYGRVFDTEARQYDIFLVAFPSPALTNEAGGTAGFFEPFSKTTGGGQRARIDFKQSLLHDFRGLIHEVFHHFEWLYRERTNFTKHVWRPAFKKHWPAWYRDEGELFYYTEVFRRTINPSGCGRIILRKQ